MTYEYLKTLKAYKPALKLIASDHFAMILSWMHSMFIAKNRRRISHKEALESLEDYLYDLNSRFENSFVKSAKHYLDTFVKAEYGYMRRYYENEELFYELTPDTYRVLEFIESLQKREFVGSGTKFSLIFELLEKLEYETLLNNREKIDAIDAKIAKLKKQRDEVAKRDRVVDDTQIKEIVLEVMELIRKLLYDFSDIEYNFRDLNKRTKEKIASTFGSKSEVLEFVFESEDDIRNSDQGKSFFAFWELLTSDKNDKLEELTQRLYSIDVVKKSDKDGYLTNFKNDLIISAHRVQAMLNRLIEQLRRFIDERAWIENRRILELIGSLEKRVIKLKQYPKNRDFMHLERPGIDIFLPLEKRMFEPQELNDFNIELKEEVLDLDLSEALFDKFWVDESRLHKNIIKLLQTKPQISLKEIIQDYPITKGVAEIIGYLSLATSLEIGYINESSKDELIIDDVDGRKLRVNVPKILFIRG